MTLATSSPFARRALGATELRVTELGFGCGPLGGFPGRPVDDDAARATLEAAWDAGIRYFDTAPWYGLGMAEHRVGELLRSKPRDAFVLSTKVGRVLSSPADPGAERRYHWTSALPFTCRFDYSREGVLRSFEDSLQRLGLARVDVLLIHDLEAGAHGEALPERLAELDGGGGFAALRELRASGAVGAIGAGLNEPAGAAALLERFELDVLLLAGRYTLLRQDALERVLPLCERQGVSMVVGGVFNSGVLAGGPGVGATFEYGPPPPEILARTRRLRDVCERHGVELGAAALRFPLGHPSVAAVVAGAAAAAEVRQNVERATSTIGPELWRELVREGLLPAAAPLPREEARR